MTTQWHVTVGFTAALSEDSAFDVMEILDEHGAVASVSRALDSGTIDLTVEASGAEGACIDGVRIVRAALERSATEVETTSVTAQTVEALEEQLATPVIPEVVGYAEIAQMAGVSRQRARQFADIESFPRPAIVTAQGPLMTKASVTQWLSNRTARRHPAKVAHA